MAGGGGARAYIYDRAGTTLLYTLDPAESTDTISSILALSWNSGGTVTNLAASVGGTALSGSTTLGNSGSMQGEDYYLYDVTPQVETITGFYLDGNKYLFPGSGPDYSWNTLTGTSFTLSGTNYRNLISTSSDTTVSVGTGLTPGMEYIIRITNTDSDNDHTMTFNSVAYIIPKSGTVTYKWLALTATTVEFEGPRYVYSMPATPEEGFIYYVLPGGARLPDAYQEVEWIQSTGTQYIDTGVTAPTNYLKTYMKINPQTVSTGSQDYRAGGAYNGSRANIHYIGYGRGRFYAGFGGGDYDTGISVSANTLYEITMEANNGSYSVTVNNSTATGTYSGSVAINRPFFLFRNNENGSAGAGGTFNIYSFQMTTSNGLVRDFVPCYRKSDTEIGMYDLVNDQFYTNSGTGTFIKGGNV